MPVTKTKKVPQKTSSQYSDTPRNEANSTTWWGKWGAAISIAVSVAISIIGALVSFGIAMHTVGKIEQEFRDNIKYNSSRIEELNSKTIYELKQKQDLLQENHHSLTVELSVQKTRLEFVEKNKTALEK